MQNKKLALITGASKGIGKAIAYELAKKEYNLLLVARSNDLLEKLSDEINSKYPALEVAYFAADLSDIREIEKLKNWYDEKKYCINFLVNNAGYGIWGHFKDANLNDQINMINLNITALVHLTHSFLPSLLQCSKAYIMNIASTAAYQSIPTMAAYGGTKSFVLSFSRALHLELKKTPVSVTCVSPGATNTHFIERAAMQALEEVANKFAMTAEEVAKQAVNATLKGKAEKVTGFLNQVSTQLTYYAPKSIPESIASNIFNK